MKTRNKPIPEISDEEEARIQALIASDPDAPEATDEQLAQARPFAEAFPELLANMRRAQERAEAGKEKVTLPLSPQILEYFKSGGPGWQSRINEALLELVRERRR